METILGIVIIGFLILFIYLLREIFCWYWKINERIELQKKTNELLRLMLNDQNAERFKLTETFRIIDTETKFKI